MITAQNKKFIQDFIATGDQTASYHVAYPRSKKWKSRSEATKAAWKLLRKPEVKAYHDQLLEKFEERAVLTREEHLNELARLRDLAVQDGRISAAIAAEVSRGKMMGFYTIKREDQNTNTNYVISDRAIDDEEDLEAWVERNRPKSITGA